MSNSMANRTTPNSPGDDNNVDTINSKSTTPSTTSPPPASGPSPSRLRFYRLITLLALLFSDGTYTVLRRYSRGVLMETYSVNEVLLMAEFIKMGFSCFMMTLQASSKQKSSSGSIIGGVEAEGGRRMERMTLGHLLHLLLRSKKMFILSLIYGLGNVLSYYALARVGAGTFVVIANLKTLTTAGFSAAILRRSYSWTKWRALVLLVAGVVLFVLPTLKATIVGTNDGDGKEDNDSTTTTTNSMGTSGVALGIGAEIIVVTLSGFASIYFEKAIKDDPFDIWERNFQLGFYSILMYGGLMVSEGGSTGKPFANWTPLAVCLSFLGATGGLLVALSIKYGDSVLKTLAISGSIIYASVVDHIFLGGLFNEQMVLAAVVVVIAVLNYNFDATGIGANVIVGGNGRPTHPSPSKVTMDRKDMA